MKTRLLLALLLCTSALRAAPLRVSSNADSGPGSLRERIAAAAPGDTIDFEAALSGTTITLTSGEIAIAMNLTIDASSLGAGVTISGTSASRVFNISAGQTVAITGITFTAASVPSSSGGAILNSGTLTLTRCAFSGNSANNGGSCFTLPTGMTTVDACTFSSNTASTSGGALSSSGTLTVRRSTFSGNNGGSSGGGAINATVFSTSLVLEHCTISGNTTTNAGGGIRVAGGAATITNCIVAGNTAGAVGTENLSGSITQTGANLTTGDPQLAALGSYGGALKTMPPLAGSPAIDAGVASAATLDQRGLTRAVDADADGTAQPDLGAVELQVRIVSTTADEENGFTTNGVSLREAINDTTGGSSIIRFDPALSGQTIGLTTFSNPGTGNTALPVNAPAGVTIDATALPGGLTIQRTNTGSTYRLFYVPTGSRLSLAGLTLKDGSGGIGNAGTLALTRCTITGCSGRALNNGGGGTATLTHCTLSGNVGGASNTGGTMALTHCTITQNTDSLGGGVLNQGPSIGVSTLSLTNTIVAGNTATIGASAGPDILNTTIVIGTTATVIRQGVNIVQFIQNGGTGTSTVTGPGSILAVAPQLAPLGDYGGSTPTHALLAGSPAVDAATSSTITSDQRGFPITGSAPDIGAVEANPVIAVRQGATAIADGSGTVDFGAVNRPGSSAAVVFTIENSGSSALTLASIAASGANAGDFQVGTPASSVIAPGSSTTFSTTFTPGAGAHSRAASVRITSDAPEAAALYDFALTGTSNEVPVAPDASVFAVQGVQKTVTIAATDADNDTLTVTSTTPDANLTVNSTSGLGITITPAANYLGSATLGYTVSDGQGGSDTGTLTVNVRPTAPVHTTQFVVDGLNTSPAPGAGTNGLPADAKLASFGIPATSDAGDVAFVGKWASATGGPNGKPVKGTGLFLNTTCLAVVGGDASVIAAGAKWKSFSDPVVEDGKLACIAALSTGAKAVVCNFTGAALEKIAFAGEQAASAGDAKFKSFKSVALHGGAIGFHATLTGGTGANKITPANDTGMWMREPAGALHVAQRDGASIGIDDSVASFVSFMPGDGSPGQGRGWLSSPAGGRMLSVRTSKEQSKAVVFGSDAGQDTLLALRGDVSTNFAPALLGARFETFRLPAMNDAFDNAFYATMKVGPGGVTKADAGGIFASTADANGSLAPYELIARIGGDAGATGGKFSVLKDPVLAQDGALAFPATLKLKGAAAKTLWWRPANGVLTLLAQGGGTNGAPTDLPSGAQWSSFSSLAIAADRGPIFTAKLVPNKGGATAATASGVWAMDFDGTLRTLFRAGDEIDLGTPGTPLLKKLKSFTLLKASVGSNGVTRSFNDAGQVVWLATFTDKTQAIVTTEVP